MPRRGGHNKLCSYKTLIFNIITTIETQITKIMKKLIVLGMVAVVLLLAGAMSAYAQEPDPRLAGVWKRYVAHFNINDNW